MAHHLLVAVVLLSACLILVVDATSTPKVDGSNPSEDPNALGELVPTTLRRLIELEQYLGELETLLVALRDSDPDSEQAEETFESFQGKLSEAQGHFDGLSLE